ETKLLSEDEQESFFVEHVVTALLRGDAQARSDFYSRMVTNGLMTRNEIRKLENLNPVDGGDVFLVQGAMVAIDDDGSPESVEQPSRPTGTPEQPNRENDDSARAS